VLTHLFDNELLLGAAQAAVALAFALLVMMLARYEHVHLERELTGALLRGLVQIVAVGSIFLLLLRAPGWITVFVLMGMITAAAAIARRRIEGIPGVFVVSLYGIAFGSGLVILPMTLLGVIETQVTALVPVGSMIIAAGMNTCALALERFRSDVESHVAQIEAGLALGAAPAQTVTPYVRSAVTASLIPHLNTLRSLGIVWIPGIMAGMILSGTDPVYAAVYQFVVIAMIFAAGGLTALATMVLVRGRVFGAAEQLLVRPGTGTA